MRGPGVDFECSWDGLCWVLLVSQGMRGAFFVPVCITWLPWGTGGFSRDCFCCARGFVGVSLCTGVCVLGLSDVFRELLTGMLGCVWFYFVLPSYFLTIAVSGASMLASD